MLDKNDYVPLYVQLYRQLREQILNGEYKQGEFIPSETEAVILLPGEVIVLNKGIWHDACHGINKSVRYYWLDEEYEGEPTEWVDICGGFMELHV